MGLEGDQLLLECGRQDSIARTVRNHMVKDLEALAARLQATFRHRLKGSREILRKVHRKRLEVDTRASPTDGPDYDPIHVEDAWACRFVVLMQPEILEVLEELLDYVCGKRGEEQRLSIKQIIVYSNRPENDPLALHNLIEQIVEDFSKANPALPAPKPPVNPESGYSSVHIVMEAVIDVDLGTGLKPKRAAFEIQVRDVFEDGWGEISHRLAYKRQTLATGGVQGQLERQLRNARARELNALKSSADACSQHATLIDRSLTYFLDTAGLTGTELTIGSIEEDLHEILGVVPADMIEARRRVADAYRMLHAAHESSVREIDNRVCGKFYRTAAGAFEQALEALPAELLDKRVTGPHGMRVHYYLMLERANATVRSIPSHLKPRRSAEARNALRSAIDTYESLRIGNPAEYGDDATIHLRLGQALVRTADSVEAIDAAIGILVRCRECAAQDPQIKMLGPRHWLPLEVLHQIALAQFDRAKLLKRTDQYLDALERAANEGDVVAADAQQYVLDDSGNINLAHKCINNALYFRETYCRQLLKERGGTIPDQEIKKIKSYVNLLRRRPYRRFVETHTETIDTLMRAANLVDDMLVARDMADKNVAKLRQIARARGSLDDLTRINEFLDPDERKMYREAMKISRPLDEEDPDEDDA